MAEDLQIGSSQSRKMLQREGSWAEGRRGRRGSLGGARCQGSQRRKTSEEDGAPGGRQDASHSQSSLQETKKPMPKTPPMPAYIENKNSALGGYPQGQGKTRAQPQSTSKVGGKTG